MKDKKMIDLTPMVDEIIDHLIECGADTYNESKYMVLMHLAFYGQLQLLEVWKKVFTRADQRRPLLIEMH